MYTENDLLFNYIYNAENQLIQVKRKSDNSLVATYAYNFNGLRKSKSVYSGQTATTTNFHWDAFGRLIRESDQSGQETATYTYDSSGNLTYVSNYLVHTNTRGDVISLTSLNSIYVYARYHYDPWGKQISYSGSKQQPFKYAGYYFERRDGVVLSQEQVLQPDPGEVFDEG